MAKFKISGNWIVGFFDAEGCFSLNYDTSVQTFNFEVFLTQKNKNLLTLCQTFLLNFAKSYNPNYDLSMGSIRLNKGVHILRIGKTQVLLTVMKPFFEIYPLLSSKRQDSLLFFAGLEIFVKNQMPKHVCSIYLTYIMYAMNTEGAQRRKSLKDTLTLFEPRFSSKTDFLEACKKAQEFVETILKKSYPNTAISNDYILGLICGDGCLHANFDMRNRRKVQVRKILSVSLMSTDRNKELLDQIANSLGFKWSHFSNNRRHNPSVSRLSIIQDIIEPFFKKHFDKLSPQKQQDFLIWSKIDELSILLKNNNGPKTSLLPTDSEANFDYIKKLLYEIYYVHSEGIYRQYSFDQICERFKKDWDL